MPAPPRAPAPSRRPARVARQGAACLVVLPSAMQKFLLVSIVLAHIALPLWAARDRDARRGLKKTLLSMLLFDAAYLAAILFIYPRL